MQWRGALALRHSLMSVVLRMIRVSIIGMSMVTAVALGADGGVRQT